MKLTLTDFEQRIDPVILKRGLQYFKKGHVTAFDEMSYGEYEAIVEGTESYTVRLTLRDEAVTEWVCDCPYDMGPVCKHIVAALYYAQGELIQQEEPLEPLRRKPGRPPKSGTPAESKPRAPKSAKRKTIVEQIEETLDAVPHDELKSYVRGLCDRDREFRQLFLARYARLTAPVDKNFYAGQIRAMVDAAAGRNRFVDYYKASGLGKSIYEIISNAEQACAQGDHTGAMQMALAVLEESCRALDFTDDSDGIMGSLPGDAIEILMRVAGAKPAEPVRKELFDYAVNAFNRRTYAGWDWHWDMARLAVASAETDSDCKKVEKMLSLGDISVGDYEYRNMLELKVEFILKTKGGVAAAEYMEKNLHNPSFRAGLIEQAIAAKDYERAIRLAKDGVTRYGKDNFGESSPDRWRDYLLTIAMIRGDKTGAVTLLRHFMVETRGGYYRSMEFCYKELKKLTPPDQWPMTIEGLIKEIERNSRGYGYERVSQLYIWESQWDKLFELLSRNASLEHIAQAERYLVRDYAVELTSLYHDGILKFMQVANNRNSYREGCRYLRRMIKIGARAEAEALIAELRATYRARRALQEELNNV